jgi:hypothetical protein
MESTTNSILTPNCSIVYRIMNEFVFHQSKKQHTQLSFILHLTFNKFKKIPKAFTLASNQFWMIFLPWVRISLIRNNLKQSFTKCPNWLNWSTWSSIGYPWPSFWLVVLPMTYFYCRLWTFLTCMFIFALVV